MTEPVVVLLRGVNVGGRNRLPMADLRVALGAAGFTDVSTYIQSGNIVAIPEAPGASGAARRVHELIAGAFGLEVPSLGLEVAELREIIKANPFPEVDDGKRLHVIVLPGEPPSSMSAAVADLEQAARVKGSRDRVVLLGRAAYLHTPDGFGSSDLAKRLTGSRGPLADGTARNWSTMSMLLDLVQRSATG